MTGGSGVKRSPPGEERPEEVSDSRCPIPKVGNTFTPCYPDVDDGWVSSRLRGYFW